MGHQTADAAFARRTAPETERLLVEQAAWAFIFLDRDGYIEHLNPGAEAMFGYSAAEAAGKHFALIFPPDDVRNGVPQEELQSVLRSGHSLKRSWKQRKDGTRFFANQLLTVLRDSDGNVVALAVTLRDATAEKKIEEHLAASEAELRLIVDSVRDYAIYLLDPDGTIKTWSRGAQQIKGYTPEEVIGRNFAMFYPPEDVAAGKPQRQLTTAAEEGAYQDESKHVRKDGSRFWAHVVVTAVRNENGELRGFVNLTHDISEQRRSRERLEFLTEVSRTLAQSIEYEETLRRIANVAIPEFADWCAIDLLSEGSVSRVAIAHEDPEKVELTHQLQKKYPPDRKDSILVHAIRERKVLFYREITDEMLRAMARDEEQIRLTRELGLSSAIVAPMIFADRAIGAITFVTAGNRRLTEDDVTLAEDIASRAAAAVANAQLYREAQEANRAKDDFLATVSHELRTPMTAVLGWARLLRGETDPEIMAEAATAIERSATAQAQLIDDILDASRIRVGKLRMDFKQTNLVDVVHAGIETMRLAAEEKQIELHVKIDRPAVHVVGDPKRLQQVVWNLLSNAVKFTPVGGHVEVTLEQTGNTAWITVCDTGVGIPPEFLSHVFERFRQAESTQQRSFGGLGLGLSIVRYIVEAHGGTIRATSGGEGKGSTFIVELPVFEGAAESKPSVERHGEQAQSLDGVSALVVEDDPATLQFLCHALERAGATCRATSSVDEALREFQAQLPDVIVSDIAMPGKTGHDLARAIQGSGIPVPMVAVTASGPPADRERALSNGFDEYLRKPVTPETLVDTVCSLLKR